MVGKLLMLLFLGLGVALAVPKTRGRILTPVLNEMYLRITPTRLEGIAAQLEMLRRRGERLPEQKNLRFWIGRMTNVPPIDPWGNDYYLVQRNDGFLLGSMGRDSIKGSEDDMTVTRETAER